MATDEEIIKDLADHMNQSGWSRPRADAQAAMWFEFLAPRIRAQQAEEAPEGDCPKCRSTALHDLLGHDPLGHKTANSLISKDVRTPDALKSKGLEWVIDFTNVGTKGINRIKDRLGPDGYEAWASIHWNP